MATEVSADVRRGAGCLLVIGGLFLGGLGAAGLLQEWSWRQNWPGAVIAPCVVTGKGESPVILCETRSEGQPPTQLSLRDPAIWKWTSIGHVIDVEYLPQDPARIRYLSSGRTSGRVSGTHTHHLRGAWRIVVCGSLFAIGMVPLLYGLRFFWRSRTRAEQL